MLIAVICLEINCQLNFHDCDSPSTGVVSHWGLVEEETTEQKVALTVCENIHTQLVLQLGVNVQAEISQGVNVTERCRG